MIGIIFLIGTFYNFTAYKRPGIYPPKRILKNRIGSLGGASLIFLFIGILMIIFAK
ncbi:hypothetical protein ACFFMO_12580 [Lederbergia wuyishanensis]